jgi:glycosyltransferase involved in cell wall biosynthesis
MHHPILIRAGNLDFDQNVMLTFHGTYFGYSKAYSLYNLGKYKPYYNFSVDLERKYFKKLSSFKNDGPFATAVSPITVSEMHSNGYQKNIDFIPNAMPNIKKIIDRKKARDSLQSIGVKLNSEDLILLYVGRIDPQKQPLLLPSFFSKISSYPSVKLIIVGSGSLSKLLKSQIYNKKNIFYLGFVQQSTLDLIYSAADAYISLSCCEGLPIGVLEASANGLPLILSDIAEHKWIISEGLGKGILVNSFKPEDYAIKALNEIEKFNHSRFYPSQKIRDRFSWIQIAKDYLSIAGITS